MYYSDDKASSRCKYDAPLTRTIVIWYDASFLLSGGNKDNEVIDEEDLF
jgi:hypothetical protein